MLNVYIVYFTVWLYPTTPIQDLSYLCEFKVSNQYDWWNFWKEHIIRQCFDIINQVG